MLPKAATHSLQTHLGIDVSTSTSSQRVASLFNDVDDNLKSLIKDVNTFLDNIHDLAPNIKFILVIDDLDNFFEWIPLTALNFTLILSTIQGTKLSRWIGSRRDKIKSLHLDPLTHKERQDFAQQVLSEHGKQLKNEAFDNQMMSLISKREAGNPTYLKMLCLEMTKFGIHEQVGSHLNQLGESLDDLLESILSRVEIDVTKETMDKLIPYLIVSADYGLSEGQLRQLIGPNGQMKLSLFLNGLEEFIEESGEGYFVAKEGKARELLTDRYCNAKKCSEARKILANLMLKDYEANDWIDAIQLQSLPFHLGGMNDVKGLTKLLSSLKFIQLCCSSANSAATFSNLLFHLQGHGLTSKTAKDKFLSRIASISAFVTKYQEILIQQPALTYQLAVNEGVVTDSFLACQPDCLMLSKLPIRDNLVALRQSLIDITACSIEKSNNLDQDHLLLAQGFSDGSITISLAKSGSRLFSLFGHSSAVTALDFVSGSNSTGDSFLASGSDNGEISFWDLNSRIRLKSWKAHTYQVSGIGSSTDGLTVVSVGWDGQCKVWSGRSHIEMSTLKLNSSPYNCVAYHPFKDYIVTGDWKGSLRFWDLTSLKCKKLLEKSKGSIQAVELSANASVVACLDIYGLVCLFEGLYQLYLKVGESKLSVNSIYLCSPETYKESSRGDTRKKVGKTCSRTTSNQRKCVAETCCWLLSKYSAS